MAKLVVLDTHRTGKQAQELEGALRSLVVGQDEAILEVVRAYQSHVTGLSPTGRPIGNFLFLGPTGSGKTRIVEALAQSLLNDRGAVVKIDCAEYQHSHEVAKLLGSPPGYLGHRETHPLLSQDALNRHHTDKVKTLGDNRKVDFSAAMIFLTSNLGATEMCSVTSPRVGFHSPNLDDANSQDENEARMSRIGAAAARRKFTPEFINRLDKIVVFKPLGEEELRKVLDIELNIVQQRLQTAAAGTPFQVRFKESAREFLLREGTDSRYGARHLKRAIERLLVQPLANLMSSSQIRRGDHILVSHGAGSNSLEFSREAAVRDGWRVAGSMAA